MRRAGIVAGFTVLSRVLGLVREMVIANAYGAGAAVDAFFVALTLPNILRRMVAEGAVSVAFVPVLTEVKTRGGVGEMRRLSSAILGILIPIACFLTALGVIFPDAVVTLFAVGFDAERARLAQELTRVMMPYVLFIALLAVAAGVLNVEGIFGTPAASPAILNVTMIVFATTMSGLFAVPIHALAWAVAVGGLLQVLLHVPSLRRCGLLVRPRFDLGHPALIDLGRRMVPAIFGLGVYQLNIVLVRLLGSFLPEGDLACYGYATRLQEVALGVFAVSISIAALPTLAHHASRREPRQLLATFRSALQTTNFLTIPSAVGLIVLAEPIVAVLFHHGEFDASSAALTARLVQLLALSIVPIGIVRVVVPMFYALGNVRAPVMASWLSLVATAGLGAGLEWFFAIEGLTFATVAAAALQLLALLAMLPKVLATEARRARAGSEPDLALGLADRPRAVVRHAALCLGAAMVPALPAYGIAARYAWFEGSGHLNAVLLLALLFLVGIGYFAMARLFGVHEVVVLQDALRVRVFGRK